MAPTPNRFMNDIYPSFPDNDAIKTVQLYAEGQSYPGYGDRHVLLQWENGQKDNGAIVTQIIQLSGLSGNYTYYAPLAKARSTDSLTNNSYITLGQFTRGQRDRILELADAVVFEKKSVVNSCRVWTRDLLTAMVEEGLLERGLLDEIDQKVPLLKRQPEA